MLGDVKAMAANLGPTSTNKRAAEMKRFTAASKLLYEMPKPSIALIQGSAAGAGLCLALACDFQLCLPTAKLTMAFSKVGLSGDYGWFFLHATGCRCGEGQRTLSVFHGAYRGRGPEDRIGYQGF